MADTRRDDDVLDALRRVVRAVIERRGLRDIDATLHDIVAAGTDVVPGAAGGSVTRSHDGAVSSWGATDARILELDDVQASLGHGPCLEAVGRDPLEGPVLVGDLGGVDAERWPSFAPTAVRLGYRSMLSIGLAGRSGGPRSSLNLYGAAPHAFDDRSRAAATAFAAPAAALLHGADEAQNLIRALASRDITAQAKGILMERFAIGADEAFAMLVRSSQETNLKLVAVADWLVAEAEERADRDADTGSRARAER